MTVQRAPSHPLTVTWRSACIDDTGRYRYHLSREWARNPDTGSSVAPGLALRRYASYSRAVYLMLNPSTANEVDDDATTRTCMGIANRLGFTRMSIINLYALRSTDPNVMLAADDRIGPENDEFLRAFAVSSFNEGLGVLIGGWGSRAEPDRIQHVRYLMGSMRIHALALNKDGQPRHPLYLPHTTVPQPWTMPSTPPQPRGRRRGNQANKQLLEEASS